MNHYSDSNIPLWEISDTSSLLPQDDDILAVLQKDLHGPLLNGNFAGSIDSQQAAQYFLPHFSPPSDDSSPSPPNHHEAQLNIEDSGDTALKRKASTEQVQEGPSQKTQHTLPAKKAAANRRKSITAVAPTHRDENRSLKRKEQNRAAQRAFRERKEKHVKELEDKVASLEAKNELASHENENLRELLSRLQNENVALKQTPFTFSMPEPRSEDGSLSMYTPQAPGLRSPSSSLTSSTASPTSLKATNFVDWNSLTAFDPTALNLLDDQPVSAATNGTRFEIDTSSSSTQDAPYTTIASNPMLMSHTSAFESSLPVTEPHRPHNSLFDSNASPWSQPSQDYDKSLLEDFFTNFLSRTEPNVAPSLSSDSPVNHHASVNSVPHVPSYSPLSSSSPASSNSDSLFDKRDHSSSDSDNGQCSFSEDLNSVRCPRTRSEMAKRIEESGPSPFAPDPSKVRKGDSDHGPVIMCDGSKALPRTQKSDKNVEVLKALRCITSDPKFKDVEMERLCTEFASKAKCDGTKVVLEPHCVDIILKKISTSSH